MKNRVDEPINDYIMVIDGTTLSGDPISGVPITIEGLSPDELYAVTGKDPMLCSYGHMHGSTLFGNTTYGFMLNEQDSVDSSNRLVICGNGTTPAEWNNLLAIFGSRARVMMDPDWVNRHFKAMLDLELPMSIS